MNAKQARLADFIEAAAFRDLYAAAPRQLAASLGLATKEIAGATLLLAPGLPQTMFNRVIGLGVERPASEADLDAVLAAYGPDRRSTYWIHWTPTAEPADLPRWLEARGFTLAARRSWAKMIRGPEPPPVFGTTLDVRTAAVEEQTAVAEAICASFGMPSAFVPWIAALAQRSAWRMFGAFDGSAAVGGAYLYIDRGTGWLGLGGVRPDYRNRGAHRALMASRIRAAIAAGCTQIVTETGEPVGDEPNPSLANMQRSGFVRVCSRLNYASPPA
ncbi:MAG TPA: GNAT family N-acetyltransferase [Burkholderiales bacterium]|nr:GNAT family N-acetyltransferase [Burkholderiales bacterium]